MKLAQSSRVVFIGYAIILALTAFALHELWAFRLAAALRLSNESLQAVALDIDATAKSAQDHIAILREEAERSLAHVPALPHPLRTALDTQAATGLFALRTLPAGTPRQLAAYVTGRGDAATSGSELAAELDAVLRLTPLFSRIGLNLPQAAWIYYTSANRFVMIYPFEHQADAVPWNDDMLAHPVFADAAPARNPARLQDALPAEVASRHLNDYIAGRPTPHPFEVTHASSVNHCALGHWIARNAVLADAKLEQLDHMHREFHKLAGQIVADYNQGYQASARRAVAGLKFRTASRNVVLALIDCFDAPAASTSDVSIPPA